MGLTVNKSNDDGGFDEKELRGYLKDKDYESAICKFIIVVQQRNEAENMVRFLRAGDRGPSHKCRECFRWMVWTHEGEGARWVCPNCLYEKLNK